MAVHILEDRASIRAAIATMHPTASEAAQLLAHRFVENPQILQDNEVIQKELLQACAISFARSGRNLQTNAAEFNSFLDNHRQAVLNIALSIVNFLITSTRRQQRWGWIGKAAALAGGVAVGAFFG